MKTPVEKLPNEGLKKLAESKKGREAVTRMGFASGGIAKGCLLYTSPSPRDS